MDQARLWPWGVQPGNILLVVKSSSAPKFNFSLGVSLSLCASPWGLGRSRSQRPALSLFLELLNLGLINDLVITWITTMPLLHNPVNEASNVIWVYC